MSSERDFTEALEPRPVAILLGDSVIAIDKIVRWHRDYVNTKVLVLGSDIHLVVYDPEGRVVAALDKLFRVVTP